MEEKLYFKSADNIELCGLLSIVNDSNKIVMLCHGLNGDKTERNSFNVFVDNEKNNYNYELFDKKIEEEIKQKIIEDEEIIKEDKQIEEQEEEKEQEEIVEEYENQENITPPDTGVIFVLKNNKWVKMICNNILDIIRRYGRFAILL